jgi:hypothetical protein
MKQIRQIPDQCVLMELFSYNLISGDLVRRATGRKICGRNTGGHLRVSVKNKIYFAHRVIWKMVTGADPIDEIDYADGDPANNSWINLREAARAENGSNTRISSRNKSGVKGVCFNQEKQKWRAEIQANKRRHTVGYFDDIQSAEIAISAVRIKLHGEFARAV